MTDAKEKTGGEAEAADEAAPPGTERDEPGPKEVGGRDGPDPTRYGDWEKKGRCIDF